MYHIELAISKTFLSTKKDLRYMNRYLQNLAVRWVFSLSKHLKNSRSIHIQEIYIEF